MTLRFVSYGALCATFFLFFVRPSYTGDIAGLTFLLDRALTVPWPEVFDLPNYGFAPSLVYVYLGVGYLKSVLHAPFDSNVFLFILKGFALLVHVFCAAAVIRHLRELNDRKKYSLSQIRWLGLAILLNPALLYNSIVSGKTDSLWVLSLSLAILFTLKRNVPATLLSLGFALFLAPEVTLPCVALIFCYQCWKEKRVPPLLQMVCFFGPSLVLSAPFLTQRTADLLLRPFISHFAAANAFNFHTLVGSNLVAANQPLFLGMNSIVTGYVFVVLSLIGLSGFLVKSWKKTNGFSTEQTLLSALLVCWIFLFFQPSVHENHHLLLLPFFFATFLRSRTVFFAFFLFSLGSTLDQAAAVETVNGGRALIGLQPLVLLSILLKLSVFVFVVQRLNNPTPESPIQIPTISDVRGLLIQSLHQWPKPFTLQKRDYGALLILTTLSAGLMFTRLGDPNYEIPQTAIEKEFNGTVHFASHQKILGFWIYLSRGKTRLEFLCDSNRGFNVLDPSYANGWVYQNLEKPCRGSMTLRVAPYLRSRTADIQFVNSSRQAVSPERVCPKDRKCQSAQTHPLFDELSSKTASPSFFHSGYFDEAFYSTSAINHLKGEKWFERTHPPLGKIWIAYSLKMFGQSPWAWRVPGATMATFLFLLLFFFARELFGSRKVAYTAAALVLLEFSTLGIGRMGTLDNQIAFWVLLCGFVLLKGLRPIVERGLKNQFYWRRRDYVLCAVFAICFGLGAATKWIMAYSILAYLVFFVGLGVTFYHYSIPKRFYRQCLLALLLFFMVALPTYASSFVPYIADTPIEKNGSFFSELIAHHKFMFGFHSDALHPHIYSSRFYTWLANDRPLMAYTNSVNVLTARIAIFGNPAIWWAILPCLLFCFFRRNLRESFPVLIAAVFFLAHFLVWGMIGRTTYIYHFFPSALFGILLISVVMTQKRMWTYAYIAACFILFVLYFPVLTGIPISPKYAKALSVFPTWVF